MKKNVYVLDTNVLLNDPWSTHGYPDGDVIISLSVLKEIDGIKQRRDEVGQNARTFARALDELRHQGSLQSGVMLKNGSQLRVRSIMSNGMDMIPSELRHEDGGISRGDLALIALMLELEASNNRKKIKKDFILVTDDINLRVICDSINISTMSNKRRTAGFVESGIYGGVSTVTVPESMITEFYANKCAAAGSLVDSEKLSPNEFVVLKSATQSGSAIARYNALSGMLNALNAPQSTFGLKPRNKEQGFALDVLLDKSISLVTLAGSAGCGKTLISLAAGCEQVLEQNIYERLIVIKPIQPVGKDIGFLPGTLEEKLDPWIAPIKDNLNFLLREPASGKKQQQASPGRQSNEFLSMMMNKGKIEIEALAFIRGRSIPNSFILLDEAQNLSLHEIKTVITRMGENSKIVLTGDLDQIDHPQLDTYTSGLTHTIERFRNELTSAHISLIKGERSPLATLAAKIL